MIPFAIPAAMKAVPWKLVGVCAAAFAILALFAHDRIMVAQNGKLKAQLHAAAEELHRISDARNKQGKATKINLGKVKDRIEQAEPKARRIEAAPLPGNCATPKEIRELDI